MLLTTDFLPLSTGYLLQAGFSVRDMLEGVPHHSSNPNPNPNLNPNPNPNPNPNTNPSPGAGLIGRDLEALGHFFGTSSTLQPPCSPACNRVYPGCAPSGACAHAASSGSGSG